MAKVKPYDIDKKEKARVLKEMFEVIEGLRTKKEIVDFLLGLFTASEALMMARRIQIAKMILDGKNYSQITKKLKVGSHTIQSVEKWLFVDDDNVKWLEQKIKKGKSINKSKKSNIRGEGLLDKYAHHRFIKDLFGL